MEICKFVEGSFIPAFDGASERFSQIAKHLTGQGIGLTIVHCYRGWSSLTEIAEQGFTTYAISPKYYYQDHSLAERIIAERKPDVIEMNDVELLMSTGLHLNQKFKVPLVYDAHFVSSVLSESLNADPQVVDEIRNQEQGLSGILSGAICFTDYDKKQFLTTTGIEVERVRTIPLGSDFESIKVRELQNSDHTVIFMGNMYYEPNSEAVEYAVEQIIPRVHAINPEIQFRFVGDAPAALKNKYSSKTIVFTGRVNSINKAFEDARVCIAPIRTGGGMRVKILTYMSSGVPIVATSIGAEGINDLKAIKIGDDAQKFAEEINMLLGNLPKSIELGRQARELATKDYSWEIIARKCVDLYKYVISNSVYSDILPKHLSREPFWLTETIQKGRFIRQEINQEKMYILGYRELCMLDVGNFVK